MAFSDLMSAADSVILSTLADLPVTLHFQDGSPDVQVMAITKNPMMEGDYMPGTLANQGQGSAVLLLWVRLSQISPAPRNGDTASVADVDYDIFQVDPDREGGGTLRMRRRKQRWDS